MATENGIQAGKAFVLIRGMDSVTYQFSQAIKSCLSQNPAFNQLPADEQDEIVASIMQTKAIQAIIEPYRAYEKKVWAIVGAYCKAVHSVRQEFSGAVSKLAREYREDQQRAEKQRAIALREALKETDNELHQELESLHLEHPETIDEWYQLSKIAGISEERRFSGNLTPRQIINEVIGWAKRVRIERQLAADVDAHIAASSLPVLDKEQTPDSGGASDGPQTESYLGLSFDGPAICRSFQGEEKEVELTPAELRLVRALWKAGPKGPEEGGSCKASPRSTG